MNAVKLNLLQRIGLEILWASARLFAMTPHWFKYYLVEPLLFFLLYHCLRYRRRVVAENLGRSFSERSEAERRTLCRKYYHTLAEVSIDTLNMAHMPPRKLRRAFSVRHVEEHNRAVAGRDWIAMLAHYGCWEYGSYWGLYAEQQMLVAAYHPLHNPVIEAFYRRLRGDGRIMRAVPMGDFLRFYLRHRDEGIEGRRLALGLIADQNPPLRPDSHWFRFLNQETVFFDGAEKLALRCRLPVYFAWTDRVGRGRYELTFKRIYDGEEPVAPNEITERYVRLLEAMIVARPELWIWSHRRWKHKRPAPEEAPSAAVPAETPAAKPATPATPAAPTETPAAHAEED